MIQKAHNRRITKKIKVLETGINDVVQVSGGTSRSNGDEIIKQERCQQVHLKPLNFALQLV